MKIYVFGNEDLDLDNKAISMAKKLEEDLESMEFVFIKPNQDLPFDNKEDVILMDTAEGLEKVEILNSQDIGKICSPTSLSAHDFDLGFQLKYLQKLGKLGEVTIVAIPIDKTPDYLCIQSILRKLVAQDMQGS